MNKISRNDPCLCGSGKKYKKCCLGADAARITKLDEAPVEVFRPAALPIANNRFVPAIACLKEGADENEDGKCLFVLVRPSRPLPPDIAIDEAMDDLDSQPDAGPDAVGPGCLRYLDKIGYRTAPGVEFEQLRFSPEFGFEDEVCEHCGMPHSHDHEFDDDFDDEDIPDQEDYEEIKSEAADAAAFIRRLPTIPIERLNADEPATTFVELRENGMTREEAIVMLLETMLHGAPVLTDSASEDEDSFLPALSRLAEQLGK
jgi:hypothetical protein